MPLSEHEQRLLEQIERALIAEDPKFASTVRTTDLRTHMRRRMYRAAALFLVGLVVLPIGVITNVWVGILGFLIMIGGLVLALSAYKRIGNPTGSAHGSHGAQPRGNGTDEFTQRRKSRPAGRGGHPHGGWRHRMEERWKRRWEERDR